MFSLKGSISQNKILPIVLVLVTFTSFLFVTHRAQASDHLLPAGNVKPIGKSAQTQPFEVNDIEESSLDITSNTMPISGGLPNRRMEDWQSWPVLPSMSETAYSIYQRGLEAGNNPRAFSKIGDGEISAVWFLTDFDLGQEYYNLGASPELQTAINYFSGSFNRQSQAARRGFNVQRVLDPDRADPASCGTGESPLDCEIRLHHPSFALISMGTNQVWQPALFETGMREIIETLLARNVVPILSTKADNLEGDNAINFIIAKLAVEYDLPVWNFWRIVQPLPNHGLQDDLEHLTYFPNDFSAPEAMHFAWPWRNLSALQALNSLMEATQL